MRHHRAKRLLASLPDDTLPHDVEAEVRAHVEQCARCSDALHEMALVEELVRRIPSAIVPLEWTPRSYTRLAGLSRWREDPDLPGADGWRLPVASLVSAAAIVILAIGIGHYSPHYIRYGSPIDPAWLQVSFVAPPDSSFLPVAWR